MMLNNLFSTPLTDKKVIVFIICYVFLVLLCCSHMSPLYFSNEWADVNVYFTMGKGMVNGKVLYTELFDHKGPFIFFLYGLGYILSNHSFLGMFLIEIAGWILMVYSIYRLANLYVGKAGACLIACTLPIFLAKLMKAGGSAEEFILISQCISFYFFVNYFKDKKASIHNPSIMLVHGILVSMVAFTKINLCLIWFFPLAGIFINLLITKSYKNFVWNALTFVCGFLIIAIPICSYLYLNNALQVAFDTYITLNSKYARATDNNMFILFIYKLLYLYQEPLSLCILAPLGAIYFPIKYIGNSMGKWTLLLAGLFSFPLIYFSNVFQYYYPIPLLLFSVLGALTLFLYAKKYIRFGQPSSIFVLAFLFIMVYGSYSQKSLMDLKTARLVENKPRVSLQNAYNIIMKEENPTLLNLSFGVGNSLFTACDIEPNIRYFLSPNLTYDSYPQMRNEQTHYIEEKKVRFITIKLPDLKRYSSQVLKSRKIDNYEYFNNLPALKENYEIVCMDTVINTIDENSLNIFALYQLKK